ncbi:MAG: outer membrane protein transport protein, partial [Myxococcales bacterium]|nr:outer membrane protein transport protein [Myxococcales bacterium]
MRILLLALLLGPLLLPVAAPASVFDVYGFSPRGRAMGNAQAAVADDHTATFYNPAGLTRRKHLVVGAGLMLTEPRLRIDRDFQAPEQRRVPDKTPDGFTGIQLGAVFPLGGLIDNRVALGVSMYLPMLTLLRADAIDAQVPQYHRYQTLPDKFVVLASVAFEPFDWLSVGAGVQVLATLDGGVDIDLEFANRRVSQRTVAVDIAPTAAPVAGLLITPLKGLRIGLSYREALQLDYALPSRLNIDDLITLAIDIRGTVLYTPRFFNLGVAYQVEPANLLASAEITWAQWSQAPDP